MAIKPIYNSQSDIFINENISEKAEDVLSKQILYCPMGWKEVTIDLNIRLIFLMKFMKYTVLVLIQIISKRMEF